jgi:hypothetical protein
MKKRATSATSADGRAGVVTWLAHVDPGQRALAKRLDRLILATVPNAVCAIKYRKPSQPLGVPFYGLADDGWIVNMNGLKARVRVGFFTRALKPRPPIDAPGGTCAIDIASADELDEKQMTAWLKQAQKLPGWGTVPIED